MIAAMAAAALSERRWRLAHSRLLAVCASPLSAPRAPWSPGTGANRLSDRPHLHGAAVVQQLARSDSDVHPRVDRPELALHRRGGGLDGLGVGHVDGLHDRAPARRLHLAAGRFQAVTPPGQEAQAGALGPKREPSRGRCRSTPP